MFNIRTFSFFLTIGLYTISIVHSQVIQSGDCPEVNVVKDFKIDDYMGKWYEYTKYPAVFEQGGKCMYAIYTKLENGTVAVANTKTNKDGTKSTSHGLATLVESGKLLVKFPNARVISDSNYWILDTDYKDYTVVFYCRAVPENKNAQFLWILTRERHPSESIIEKAYNVIDTYKLNRNLFTQTDQSNCPQD